MWYFSWILGIGLALALGIINVMWLEANYAFGLRDEDKTRERFEKSRQLHKEARLHRRSTDHQT
ncbi:MAG TPA: cytochrome bd-I oxidase subunit CydX [Noviherbaspirillum sp.]|nr:cytochrome bd-I oxidase subunit CydX [Noviherbaspirillum sp.]